MLKPSTKTCQQPQGGMGNSSDLVRANIERGLAVSRYDSVCVASKQHVGRCSDGVGCEKRIGRLHRLPGEVSKKSRSHHGRPPEWRVECDQDGSGWCPIRPIRKIDPLSDLLDDGSPSPLLHKPSGVRFFRSVLRLDVLNYQSPPGAVVDGMRETDVLRVGGAVDSDDQCALVHGFVPIISSSIARAGPSLRLQFVIPAARWRRGSWFGPTEPV